MLSILFGIVTALLAATSAVLCKQAVKDADCYSVTAVKTCAVIVLAVIYSAFTGAFIDITSVGGLTLFYLILSGVALGGSWLFYFQALKTSELIRVQPVSSFSTVVLMLMSMLFLGENYGLLTIVGISLCGAGTVVMCWKKGNKQWLLFAWLSAVVGATSMFFAKLGLTAVGSTLGMTVNAVVIFFMLWIIAFAKGKKNIFSGISAKGALFAVLALVAACGAYFTSLYVAPTFEGIYLDKFIKLLTLVLALVGGRVFFKEKPSSFTVAGGMLVAGGFVVTLFA